MRLSPIIRLKPNKRANGFRWRFASLLAGLLLAVFVPMSAYAQATINNLPARASLVPEQTSLEPGGTLWLALDIELAPGWHTYWENPGDSGLPVEIDWLLPPGFEAGQPLYPVPERQPFGPIINYGFENRATTLWPIKVPDSLELGQIYYLSAAVNYLVCAEICIPATAEFDIQVPYKGSAPLIDSAMASFFDEARAKLPQEFPAEAWVAVSDADPSGDLVLSIPAFVDGLDQLTDWYFFSRLETVIDHGMPQKVMASPDSGGVLLSLPRQEKGGELPAILDGVLVATDRSSGTPLRLGFNVVANITVGTAAANALVAAVADGGAAAPQIDVSVIGLLAMAFVGGLLLNLMPCVFPVLSLKLLALVRHREAGNRGLQQRQGLFYGLGVLMTMLLLGAAVLGLRAAGMSVGWGFQLQEPVLIGFLAVLFFTLGLGMLGVLPLPQLFGAMGTGRAGRNDALGSFLTGVLAVVAASPCTAPFMATAIGAALLLPTALALGIFASLGLGMAMPLVLLSVTPALADRLPRPGPWMVRLQQFLAFPLFATTIWLVFVISEQRGSLGVVMVLGALLAVGFAVWLPRQSAVARIAALGFGLVLPVTGIIGLNQLPLLQTGPNSGTGPVAMPYESYSPARLQTALANDRNVFIDATAAWCVTCLVNKRVALDDPDVITAFAEADVLYLEADWTNRDPVVTKLLEEFGRLGLPLYVVYRAGSETPTVLPQILLPSMLVNLYDPERGVQQASIFD